MVAISSRPAEILLRTNSFLLAGTFKQRKQRQRLGISLLLPLKAAIKADLPTIDLLVKGFDYQFAETRVVFSLKKEEQIEGVVSIREANDKVLELEQRGWFCHSSFIPNSYQEKKPVEDEGEDKPKKKRAKADRKPPSGLSWYICRTRVPSWSEKLEKAKRSKSPLNEPTEIQFMSTEELEAEVA